MAADAPLSDRLTELAEEKSSDKRRDLLRELTDAFMVSPTDHSEAESAHYDAILSQVAYEVEASLRQELAERLADVPNAPRGIVYKLAHDELNVASPVLTRSKALKDEDLVRIIREKGPGHIKAITRRAELNESVTSEIVDRGDDDVLVSLAKNRGARISRPSMEKMVKRSETVEALQAPLVRREDIPPDLLNEMYFTVGAALRQEILKKNQNLDSQMVDQLIADSQETVIAASRSGEYANSAERYVAGLEANGELREKTLAELLESGRKLEFTYAFARLVGIDHPTALRILSDKTFEPLTIACRAAEFDQTTFAKIVFLIQGDGGGGSLTLLDQYNCIDPTAAGRVIRFWRIRANTKDECREAPQNTAQARAS